MDLKERLSSRCHIEDIHEILFYVQGNQERKAELYDLIFDPDDAVSYQALWVCSHFSTKENEWLYDKQDELINEVLNCDAAMKNCRIRIIRDESGLAVDYKIEEGSPKTKIPP